MYSHIHKKGPRKKNRYLRNYIPLGNSYVFRKLFAKEFLGIYFRFGFANKITQINFVNSFSKKN